eukprot:TRINITY_DN32851_c0_g1_i1.p1 TRINITY_DN32851_c0_g1~~TRINITY_DN32851_c0_g1_i1.p1  ORF type:complete len:322 (-),score=82.48 TRINITY_DN32851_c0_g1_i1:168-1133(-)
MIRRPPRSTLSSSSAASDVYKRQVETKQCLNQWVTQEVSYNIRDLLTYAVGIGCTDLQFVHENDGDFQAFPTYPIVLAFKGIDQDVVSFPSPAMDEGPSMPPLPGVKAGLDGERYIEKVNELDPDGAKLILRSRLAGVFNKGKGASVQSEAFLEDEDGKVFYKMQSGSFLVGANDFVDSGETFFKSHKIPNRSPDKVEEMFVPENQAQVYRLSGDYNPLHVDPETAEMMGFKVPILHGLCSLGYTTRAFMKHYCNNDQEFFKSIGLRFASPVLPGQTLVVEMWEEKGGRVLLQTKVKETGKVCISNAVGVTTLTPEIKAKL